MTSIQEIRLSRRNLLRLAGLGTAAVALNACAASNPTATPDVKPGTPLAGAPKAPEAKVPTAVAQSAATKGPEAAVPTNTAAPLASVTRTVEAGAATQTPRAAATGTPEARTPGATGTPAVSGEKQEVRAATATPAPTRTPVADNSPLLESAELEWQSQDEFTIPFGDKPFGNRTMHTVIQIWRQAADGSEGGDVSTNTHVLLEAGSVLRVPVEKNGNRIIQWAGAEWEVYGPVERLAMRMEGMAQEVVERDRVPKPYMLYVGTGKAPEGWKTELPAWGKNWKPEPGKFPRLNAAPQAETQAVAKPTGEAGKLESDKGTAVISREKLSLKAEQGTHIVFQGWDAKDVKTTKQIVVPEGSEVEVDGQVDGTAWKFKGNISDVAKRAKEMEQEWTKANQRAVAEGAQMKTYWAGKGNVPEGLEKAPEGWRVK